MLVTLCPANNIGEGPKNLCLLYSLCFLHRRCLLLLLLLFGVFLTSFSFIAIIIITSLYFSSSFPSSCLFYITIFFITSKFIRYYFSYYCHIKRLSYSASGTWSNFYNGLWIYFKRVSSNGNNIDEASRKSGEIRR
jgi:hypothetical protein